MDNAGLILLIILSFTSAQKIGAALVKRNDDSDSCPPVPNDCDPKCIKYDVPHCRKCDCSSSSGSGSDSNSDPFGMSGSGSSPFSMSGSGSGSGSNPFDMSGSGSGSGSGSTSPFDMSGPGKSGGPFDRGQNLYQTPYSSAMLTMGSGPSMFQPISRLGIKGSAMTTWPGIFMRPGSMSGKLACIKGKLVCPGYCLVVDQYGCKSCPCGPANGMLPTVIGGTPVISGNQATESPQKQKSNEDCIATLVCMLSCKDGYKLGPKGSNGCQTCQCTKTKDQGQNNSQNKQQPDQQNGNQSNGKGQNGGSQNANQNCGSQNANQNGDQNGQQCQGPSCSAKNGFNNMTNGANVNSSKEQSGGNKSGDGQSGSGKSGNQLGNGQSGNNSKGGQSSNLSGSSSSNSNGNNKFNPLFASTMLGAGVGTGGSSSSGGGCVGPFCVGSGSSAKGSAGGKCMGPFCSASSGGGGPFGKSGTGSGGGRGGSGSGSGSGIGSGGSGSGSGGMKGPFGMSGSGGGPVGGSNGNSLNTGAGSNKGSVVPEVGLGMDCIGPACSAKNGHADQGEALEQIFEAAGLKGEKQTKKERQKLMAHILGLAHQKPQTQTPSCPATDLCKRTCKYTVKLGSTGPDECPACSCEMKVPQQKICDKVIKCMMSCKTGYHISSSTNNDGCPSCRCNQAPPTQPPTKPTTLAPSTTESSLELCRQKMSLCIRSCKYGYHLQTTSKSDTQSSCPVCTCLPAPKPTAAPTQKPDIYTMLQNCPEAVHCMTHCRDYGYTLETVERNECPVCKCNIVTVQILKCNTQLNCPYGCNVGYKCDSDGCPTCECVNPTDIGIKNKVTYIQSSITCSAHFSCIKKCEFGYKTGQNGCPTCSCLDIGTTSNEFTVSNSGGSSTGSHATSGSSSSNGAVHSSGSCSTGNCQNSSGGSTSQSTMKELCPETYKCLLSCPYSYQLHTQKNTICPVCQCMIQTNTKDTDSGNQSLQYTCPDVYSCIKQCPNGYQLTSEDGQVCPECLCVVTAQIQGNTTNNTPKGPISQSVNSGKGQTSGPLVVQQPGVNTVSTHQVGEIVGHVAGNVDMKGHITTQTGSSGINGQGSTQAGGLVSHLPSQTGSSGIDGQGSSQTGGLISHLPSHTGSSGIDGQGSSQAGGLVSHLPSQTGNSGIDGQGSSQTGGLISHLPFHTGSSGIDGQGLSQTGLISHQSSQSGSGGPSGSISGHIATGIQVGNFPTHGQNGGSNSLGESSSIMTHFGNGCIGPACSAKNGIQIVHHGKVEKRPLSPSQCADIIHCVMTCHGGYKVGPTGDDGCPACQCLN